jgi:hypothetical protein
VLRSLVVSWPGRVLLALFGTGSVLFFVALVGLLLAMTGGPGPCEPGGGPVTISLAGAAEFQHKWRAFEETLNAGSPATVTFTESEITSRAEQRLDEIGRDFHDLRVCVHQGHAEATATLDLPGFTDIRGRVQGRVDLTTPHPAVRIDDVSVGNVPGLLAEPAEDLLERALQEALQTVDLEHRAYTIAYRDGAVSIRAEP